MILEINKEIENNILNKEKISIEEKIRTIEMIIFLYRNNYYTIAHAITLIQKLLNR